MPVTDAQLNFLGRLHEKVSRERTMTDEARRLNTAVEQGQAKLSTLITEIQALRADIDADIDIIRDAT